MLELVVCLSLLLALVGPVALIISLVTLVRLNNLSQTIKNIRAADRPAQQPKPYAPPPAQSQPAGTSPRPPLFQTLQSDSAAPPHPATKIPLPLFQPQASALPSAKKITIEQQIGTRWLLIAGVISLFVAAVFFAKYAYDTYSIGPWGRFATIAVSGLVALAVGEITRRRSYGIVARGVTALGFGLLYTAIFSAHSVFEPQLISTTPAFALAIAVTAAAMIYALALDEVLIAFLSLLGGFATPVIVNTGQNLPIHLFSYTLILSLGAIACSYCRKWPAVNLLAFVGTFTLYTGWFERYYRPAGSWFGPVPAGPQFNIAISFLSVFFVLYLVMPLLYGFVKRTCARRQDVTLMLAGAIAVFYYLWNLMYADFRAAFTLCLLGLAAVHIAVAFVFLYRCPEDKTLRTVALAIGMLFITIAAPVYYELNALVIAWAGQSVVLTLIGRKYKSIVVQIFAFAAIALAFINLLLNLPMHSQAFRFILNPDFGTWCMAAAAAFVSHVIYRTTSSGKDTPAAVMAQILYALAGAIFFAGALFEWYAHVELNMAAGNSPLYDRGLTVIFTIMIFAFSLRPVCPRGIIRHVCAALLIAAGSVCAVSLLIRFYDNNFKVFINPDFAIFIVFLVSIFFYQLTLRFTAEDESSLRGQMSQILYGLIALLLFIGLTAQWYQRCKYNISLSFDDNFLTGEIFISAFITFFLCARPLSPAGIGATSFAAVSACAGSVFIVAVQHLLYNDAFRIFFNMPFLADMCFIASIIVAAIVSRQNAVRKTADIDFPLFFLLVAVVLLLIVLTQQIWLYWQCRDLYAGPVENWQFLAHMYISICWAVYAALMMLAGFTADIKITRYLSLALFAVLLAKVFIKDTIHIKNVYRIAAFFATGLALLAVSYLYQFFRKKGFFDNLLNRPEKTSAESKIIDG